MVRHGYCKTCRKEVRPKYGQPTVIMPVWKEYLFVILFVVMFGISLIILLLKRINYCPSCGNEVVKFKSRDEVSRYYLKEGENQFRDALELRGDKEVSSSFRKGVQDEVSQYRELKDNENHLKDGLELNDN